MQPLALTPGEPAGIGPDLVVALAQLPAALPWVAVGDAQLLRERARCLGTQLEVRSEGASGNASGSVSGNLSGNGVLVVRHVQLHSAVVPGVLNRANAAYVLATLERATAGCVDGEFAALVTGPVHKGVIADAGFAFTGHTEWLAERLDAPQVT